MNYIGICNNQVGKDILSSLPLPPNREKIIFEVATHCIVWKNYHFIRMIEHLEIHLKRSVLKKPVYR